MRTQPFTCKSYLTDIDVSIFQLNQGSLSESEVKEDDDLTETGDGKDEDDKEANSSCHPSGGAKKKRKKKKKRGKPKIAASSEDQVGAY